MKIIYMHAMALRKHRKLIMAGGAFYIPKSKPLRPLGQDAHFFCPEAQVIGVADGVGGWLKAAGIDSGFYARDLMQNAAEAVSEHAGPDNSNIVDPKQILKQAHANTEGEGTATACILTLAGDVIRAANLGDSGFTVIRSGKTVYKSPVQQTRFNAPYQMGQACGQGPEAAEELEVKVEKGDVVVVGTDGFFDNMFPEDIEAVVNRWFEEMNPPAVLAWALAGVARQKSLQKTVPSPFELAACAAGVRHSGGKPDDITVAAAYIIPNNRTCFKILPQYPSALCWWINC